MTAPVRLVLFTTAGCHLCEQAAELLEELGKARAIAVDSVDIATETSLVDAYGIRIPVVKNCVTGKEIGWPFQMRDLESLLD